ncbi:uncharacterized protein LOC132029871 isoform X3 [Lycium ferocissimum]|nr:uncharacterized protein LOC132029871 isoform X3 [Lycium ferocissimum]
MKKKDIQICSPFGSSSKSKEKLPPVDVPKFKCWRCCIREVGATTAAAYILSKMKYVSETRNDNNVVGNMTDKVGDGTGSEGVRIEKIGNPATEVIASKQCSAREIEPKSPVANPSNSSTKIAVTEPIPSNDGNDKVVPHDGDIDPEKEKKLSKWTENCFKHFRSNRSTWW